MHNVNSSTAAALMADSRSFRAKLVFEHDYTVTADRIYRISTDWASADKDICPGQVLSNGMSAEVAGDIGDLTSLSFMLYFTLFNAFTGETYEDIPMGMYKVLSCKKQGAKTLIEAHDRLYSLPDVTYISDIEYPATVYDVEREICDLLGIGYPDIQCDMLIPNRVTCTMREMLGYCASLQGHFATLDRNGKLLTTWYTDSGYDISPNRAKEPEIEQQTIEYTKLSVSGGESVLSYGTGDREMSFVNPYMTQAQLDTIAPSILAVTYKPMTVQHILSDPRLDVWDMVTVTASGTQHRVPVATIAHSYDGGLSAVVGAVGSTTEEVKTSSVKGPLKQAVEDVSKKVEALETDAVKADYLKANYANIDFANIGTAAIEKLFSDSGIIGNMVMQEGHVTGTLVGVTIVGDLIEGNTIKADRLVVQGEDGLYYKLNVSGESVLAEQTEYNSLNGSIITAKSVTASQIAAGTITANELNVNDIFSSRAVINTLTATQAFIQAISTNSVVVGAQMDIAKAKKLATEQGITIGKWCYENDTTFIDGGAIYTGTIDAEKLNVNELSAITGNIGTLTAGTILSEGYNELATTQGMKIDVTGSGEISTFKLTADVTTRTTVTPSGIEISREDADGEKTCVWIDAFNDVKSGFVYVYYDGVVTASMSGGYDGGFNVYNNAGEITGNFSSTDYGGSLVLKRDNQQGLVYDALTFDSTESGGYLRMYHPGNQSTVVELSSLSATGGQLNLYNALGSTLMVALGSTGDGCGYVDVKGRELARCDGATLDVALDRLSLNGAAPCAMQWVTIDGHQVLAKA